MARVYHFSVFLVLDNDYAESILSNFTNDGAIEDESPIYISTEDASRQATNQKPEEPEDESTIKKEIIWCRKKPTEVDIEATTKLLQLRQEMATQFDDRRTVKSKLWNRIACILQEEFNLGDNGVEKCRQKFANLQRMYLAYVKHQRSTGSGRNDNMPPFFDQLHSILGMLFILSTTYQFKFTYLFNYIC